MRTNEKLYNEAMLSKGYQSYFSDSLSETDVYNLHIRMMNLLTQEDFSYLK
jgi:hypothetical protein